MIITLIAPGSRGDVQPYLALAKGLKGAGHTARLVTHADFAPLVTAHGVEMVSIPGSVRAIAQSEAMAARIEGGNFARVLAQMARDAERGAAEMAKVGLAAGEGADLVVAGLGGLFTGVAVAEKLQLPFLQAYYIPMTPTRAYPSFVASRIPSWLGPIAHPLSYRVARQMIWQGFRRADRRTRREVLHLPPAPVRGPFHRPALRDGPILYGYSPVVLPPPDDWRANVHVTGYWTLPEDDDRTPPADLVAFLEAGSPPVYIGFGSMATRDPEALVEVVLAAVARSGRRALLLSGWGGLRTRDLPESVFPLEGVPFTWLFPRCAAVVHHGGAGTTAAGLRAGVPSIVVPFFGDQPFWGRRVFDLGAGPAPIPRRRLTAARLADAVQSAMLDVTMQERAAAIGARIRQEDGVGTAVGLIEQLMARGEVRVP